MKVAYLKAKTTGSAMLSDVPFRVQVNLTGKVRRFTMVATPHVEVQVPGAAKSVWVPGDVLEDASGRPISFKE